MAGQRFIKNHAQREHIRSSIRRFFQKDFWRHIGRGTRHRSGAIHCGTLVGAWQVFGDAKVQDFHLTRGSEHDIFWLNVAVNDAAFVGRGQCVHALGGDVEEFLQ